MKVRLFPGLDKFGLMTAHPTEGYEIHIQSVSLFLCAITPSPKTLALHDSQFKKRSGNFIYEKSILKSHSVAKGQQEFVIDQVFGSLIPKTLYLVLVSSESYQGDYALNPFNFQHFNLSKISYDAENIPLKLLEPDFAHNNYADCYSDLYRSLSGQSNCGPITFNDFRGGYAIFKINIPESEYVTRRGYNRLTVRFSAALTDNVTCIMYGKFSARFTLSEDRLINDEIII